LSFNSNHVFKPFARDTRSPVLEESLRKLGVEKLSKDDVQRMQWELLEAKIGNWIHFMRIAVRTELIFAFSFLFLLSFLMFHLSMSRSSCSLLENEKCVIKYSKALILLGINALLMSPQAVYLCCLVLVRQLLEARGHQRNYLCF